MKIKVISELAKVPVGTIEEVWKELKKNYKIVYHSHIGEHIIKIKNKV